MFRTRALLAALLLMVVCGCPVQDDGVVPPGPEPISGGEVERYYQTMRRLDAEDLQAAADREFASDREERDFLGKAMADNVDQATDELAKAEVKAFADGWTPAKARALRARQAQEAAR